MKFINTIFKYIDTYKRNILVIMLILITVSGILGISYYMFFNNKIEKYQKNNYMFKVYHAGYIDSDYSTYNKLKESKHVVDIFSTKEYTASVIFKNGWTVDLFGTIPNNMNMVDGRTFNIDSDDEIICPDNFNDDETEFLKNKTKNISQYLNKSLVLTDYDDNETKVKLVGIFASKDGVYEPTYCFASHKTLQKINEKMPQYYNSESIYIQIDDNSNLEKLKEQFPTINFSKIQEANNDIRNLVCGICLFIYVISLFIIIEIMRKIAVNVKAQGSIKNKIISVLKLELKPLIIGIMIGLVITFIINYLVIPKLIPSIYLFYNNYAEVKIIYVLLNILVTGLIVVMSNLRSVMKIEVKK